MAISTTTFAERLATIEKNAPAIEQSKKHRLRSGISSFPFLFALTILIGGTAYACLQGDTYYLSASFISD